MGQKTGPDMTGKKINPVSQPFDIKIRQMADLKKEDQKPRGPEAERRQIAKASPSKVNL